MTVKAILSRKGSDVATIAPAATLSDAVKLLAERRIGAVVVTGPGIASPASSPSATSCVCLPRAAPAALDEQVGSVMTRKVVTCTGDETVSDIMERMTAAPLPSSPGGRAGQTGRHHLDRRRGEAPRRGDRGRVRTRCAITSQRHKAARSIAARRRLRRSTSMRAFGGFRAERDRLLRAVELEHADLAELRVDQDVRRIAGEPRTRDAVLHHVEGFHHHGGDAGTLRGAEEAAFRGLPVAAEDILRRGLSRSAPRSSAQGPGSRCHGRKCPR